MEKKILFFMILLVLPFVSGYEEHGHMHLLAVQEGEISKGSIADLYLDIRPGSGRVFIETFPITKMDTQISTRYAKDIACDFIDENCDNYDFFYTIKANSPIIGGPSAGAAISILTAAMLSDIEIDEKIAMTGTINSGGTIGPVGGLVEKIDAAGENGIKTVLIPDGTRFVKKFNLTLDLEEYSDKYSIEVIEVSDLNEALYEFSGKLLKEKDKELNIDDTYNKIMKNIAENLCERSYLLEEGLDKEMFNESELKDIENLTEKGKNEFEKGYFYSSASYCYGANVRSRAMLFEQEDKKDFKHLSQEIDSFETVLENKKIATITDLQTYMIAKERIEEAKNILDMNETDNYNMAYAKERIYSAESWSSFFGKGSNEFFLEEGVLKESCMKKLSEAEERYDYVRLYLKGDYAKEDLVSARENYQNEKYEMCLFYASKAKAQSDIILGLIGVREEDLEKLVDNKLRVLKRNIIEDQEKGVFPILAYSYYEYSNSLKAHDLSSALLYAEYALEFSNWDIYFKKENSRKIFIDHERLLVFFIGLITGIIICLLLKRR